ncbi:TetR/AcrR family transcriptional regulator [Actinotalea sp. K2]|uniref:TetR/AcrR family transcriptional regulator n=1 Tax=Actinotalea sp. K2 TaxID=2939438 RepID=UPI002016BA7D|nr:TetR/AcrR family transcriptional regulator [Actinotalea sp. K2]MCL3859494.1 TetR/AcrR family transcriptional regulator [Actinotalea sp. K2]
MGAETKERVLQVARDLIHASSYTEVSLQDICDAAGVRKGSLFHFFPSKEALGLAVAGRNRELLAALLDETLGTEAPPLERLTTFFHAFARMLATMRQPMGSTPGCPLGGLAAELGPGPSDLRAAVTRDLEAWAGRFEGAVREAQARGEVDAATDPRAGALALLAHLQGAALLAHALDDPDVVHQAAGAVPHLLAPR